MKSRALIIGTILAFIIAIMIPEVAAAKKPPSDEDPIGGELYGDLFVLERDGAGEPLTREVTYTDPETGEDVTVGCPQPLRSDCALLPFWGECGSVLPDGVLELPEDCVFDPESYDACAVYDDGSELYSYASELQEVSFGRGSVTRSQAFVIDSAYGEFLKVINDAGHEVEVEGEVEGLRLDPADRFEMKIPSEIDPDDWFWKTVDAPLENLGMYREAMIHGCFDIVTEETTGEEGAAMIHTSALDPTAIFLLRQAGLGHLVCPYVFEPELTVWTAALAEEGCTVTDDPVGANPDIPCWWEVTNLPGDPEPGEGVSSADMQSATSFLAAATDKANPMSLDEMININTYIGINTYRYEDGGTNKAKPDDRILVMTYFPFVEYESGVWFMYDRETMFPVDETAELLVFHELTNNYSAVTDLNLLNAEQNLGPYSFVDLEAVNLTVCRQGFPAAGLTCDSTDLVGCGGANWFAQATEHARKTVWYLHNWSVPELAN